ncbi:MAG: triple tyrosine motif-containing protein, partial [Flavobacteriales bacterium]
MAFGTNLEVVLYNGEGFNKVPVGSGGGVYSMALDRQDRLFVGGRGVMGVLVPDSSGVMNFRSLIPLLPDSLQNIGTVWNTVCSEDGKVWFNALDRLFLYEGDSIRTFRPRKRFFLMHKPGKHPVLEEDTGLFRMEAGKKSYLEGSKELSKGKGIHALLPAIGHEKDRIAFTHAHGLFRFDPSEAKVQPFPSASLRKENPETSYSPEGGWKGARIYEACRLDTGKNPFDAAYAVGTVHKGVYLLGKDGAILLHIGKAEGLPAKHVWKLLPDGRGNIWAGTNNGIALLHTGLPFTFAEKGGLFEGSVLDVARPKKEGAPLFLATQGGAWAWNEKAERFSLLKKTSGQCFDLLPFSGTSNNENEKLQLLVAGGHRGVISVRKNGTGSFKVDSSLDPHALQLARIPALDPSKKQGSKGFVVGGRMGVYAYERTPFSAKGEPTPLLAKKGLGKGIGSVRAERKEEDSLRIWVGTDVKGSFALTTDTGFQTVSRAHYDTTDGISSGVVRIFSDPKGTGVLFGADSGLYRFKKESFRPCCRFGKIFCDHSRQAYELKQGMNGEVWINDALGGEVKHLIPKGDGYRIDSTIFRCLEIGTIRCIHPEKNRVWIGGNQGLACYYPGERAGLGRKWNCVITQVLGAGDSILYGGFRLKNSEDRSIPILPYSRNRLKFKYAAPFPDEQKAVSYSYKLVGFEKDWSEWTQEIKKEYTNLPEGNYSFKVKARNIYLKESRTTSYRFHILPPWYRTWTAYGGYTVAGIGFLWLILWLNGRRLVAQKERLEGIVDERTKEIRKQKEKVEEQQKETEKQKEEVEKQKEKLEEQQKETEKQRQVAEERREKIQAAHEEITQSIDYAQKIQYALLQSEEHVSPHLPEHFILFKPQSQVSGDFYWGKEHKGFFYLAAVDCTGHGVPGAFMSMLGISQLSDIMNTEEVLTPGYILSELRDRIVRELTGADPDSTAKDGMDAAMVRIPLSE